MYMKNRLTFVALLVTGFIAGCKQPGGSDAKRAEAATAAAQDRDAKAIAVIKDFYTAYMYQLAASGPVNKDKLDSITSQYCSSELTAEIHRTAPEADAFIHAQDCDSAWVKTLMVTKDSLKLNTYSVAYKAGDSSIIIHARLNQAGDGVVIDWVY